MQEPCHGFKSCLKCLEETDFKVRVATHHNLSLPRGTFRKAGQRTYQTQIMNLKNTPVNPEWYEDYSFIENEIVSLARVNISRSFVKGSGRSEQSNPTSCHLLPPPQRCEYYSRKLMYGRGAWDLFLLFRHWHLTKEAESLASPLMCHSNLQTLTSCLVNNTITHRRDRAKESGSASAGLSVCGSKQLFKSPLLTVILSLNMKDNPREKNWHLSLMCL